MWSQIKSHALLDSRNTQTHKCKDSIHPSYIYIYSANLPPPTMLLSISFLQTNNLPFACWRSPLGASAQRIFSENRFVLAMRLSCLFFCYSFQWVAGKSAESDARRCKLNYPISHPKSRKRCWIERILFIANESQILLNIFLDVRRIKLRKRKKDFRIIQLWIEVMRDGITKSKFFGIRIKCLTLKIYYRPWKFHKLQ